MNSQNDLWHDAPPPSTALAVCVVIPVRNEAASLERSLAALAAQSDASRRPFDHRRYELLLLANNCTDRSAAIAREFAGLHRQLSLHVAEVELPPHEANIGHVRRLLMDAAAARLNASPSNGVIASTDGDTVVAHDWLARTLHDIESGADAVGGRIAIDAGDDIDADLRRRRRCDAAYRLAEERLASLLDPEPADPWPRHHQHFCGSLAVTRAAYVQVGGLPRVPYLEDEALVAALRRHDLRIRHSPTVRVVTSGRHVGRAEVGLAWQLRQWAQNGTGADGPMVDDAPVLAARFTARHQLRGVWQRRRRPCAGDPGQVDRLARRWQLSGEELASRVVEASAFGALWAELEARLPQSDPSTRVPVRTAITGLRALARTSVGSQPG